MRDAIAFHAFPLAGIDPMSASTARAFPRHTHDQYGIGIVDAGGHASWSGRGQVEAGPGHLHLRQSRRSARRARDRRPAARLADSLFRSRGARRLACRHPRRRAALVHVRARRCSRIGLAPAFEAAFRARERAWSRVRRWTARPRCCAWSRGSRAHSTARPRGHEGPTACIRARATEIDADPAAPLTLIELAKEAGLSRYQLIRAFARELGLTPHAYILQRRIALAQRMIRAGCDLAEVATGGRLLRPESSHALVRAAVRRDSAPLRCRCALSRAYLLALPAPKRRDLGAIAAGRGAAEHASVRFRPIQKPQRAIRARAGFDECRILLRRPGARSPTAIGASSALASAKCVRSSSSIRRLDGNQLASARLRAPAACSAPPSLRHSRGRGSRARRSATSEPIRARLRASCAAASSALRREPPRQRRRFAFAPAAAPPPSSRARRARRRWFRSSWPPGA